METITRWIADGIRLSDEAWFQVLKDLGVWGDFTDMKGRPTTCFASLSKAIEVYGNDVDWIFLSDYIVQCSNPSANAVMVWEFHSGTDGNPNHVDDNLLEVVI